ncbi:MAG: dihydrodipicolinate synthase family protein [Chloroflexota bacterium]|nr:dihydrodipicolinate synthase family protein [Chloroflexota bacterium]
MTTEPARTIRADPGLRGTWYILPTPFDANGRLDTPSLGRLVEAAATWGVDGLTAMGVMAEPGSLNSDERESALQTIFEAAGRLPVAVGCSASTVAGVVASGRRAEALGAVALMVAPPVLLRNVDLLPGFYGSIAAGVDLPLIVQDEPVATGVSVPVSILVACLSASGARTVKLEDPPTPPKIGRLLAEDPTLTVFGGLGGAAALWELERGAAGTMTGFAYPEILRAIRLAHEAGDAERAGRLFDRYLPLLAYEAQPTVGLAIRKEVLRRRGALANAGTRGPGNPLDGPTLAALDGLLDRLGIEASIEPYGPTT